jgi:hypothetical protein
MLKERTMTTLRSLLHDAREEFLELLKDDPPHPSDLVHEVADGAVPVYTVTLLELATENIELATDTPELGPAFGGEPTPVNIIAANVYEAVTAELYEALAEHREQEA